MSVEIVKDVGSNARSERFDVYGQTPHLIDPLESTDRVE